MKDTRRHRYTGEKLGRCLICRRRLYSNDSMERIYGTASIGPGWAHSGTCFANYWNAIRRAMRKLRRRLKREWKRRR